ncbi:hypothetical protein ACFX1X_020772 [Malus domestica]
MHTTAVNYRYKRSASRLTVGAHLFGILAIILMLVWLLHYRGGIDYDSDNSDRVFNVHPFLMFFGFIFFAGEAMMAYKTVMSEHQGQKYMHALLHLIALCTGIFGICAAFRYHDMRQIDDMYTLHSWIGLGTFILYGLQWLVGAAAFLFPGGTAESRLRLIPWHMSMGRTILYLSICAALTGLMQKFTFLGLSKALGDRESHLINFTALAILLFGIFVDLSVALARYVHTFLMVVGFILIGGEAIMAYKTVQGTRNTQKEVHVILHLLALAAIIFGFYCAIQFNHESRVPHFLTLHSWLGITTISLFGIQYLFGFVFYVFPGGDMSSRGNFMPWHTFFGMVIFLLAVCTAETGLMERFFFLAVVKINQEVLIVNFTGLLLFLFAATVSLTVLLPRLY